MTTVERAPSSKFGRVSFHHLTCAAECPGINYSYEGQCSMQGSMDFGNLQNDHKGPARQQKITLWVEEDFFFNI